FGKQLATDTASLLGSVVGLFTALLLLIIVAGPNGLFVSYFQRTWMELPWQWLRAAELLLLLTVFVLAHWLPWTQRHHRRRITVTRPTDDSWFADLGPLVRTTDWPLEVDLEETLARRALVFVKRRDRTLEVVDARGTLRVTQAQHYVLDLD